MPDKPPEMLRLGREPDPVFAPDEELYRRIPPELWAEPPYEIELDAIDFVGMSVNRSKYSLPEWVLLEDDEHASWGVIAFLVRDIPDARLHLGQFSYRHWPEHIPLKENYSHSEVRGSRDGKRFERRSDLDDIDREYSLIWREQLLWKAKLKIRPAGAS